MNRKLSARRGTRSFLTFLFTFFSSIDHDPSFAGDREHRGCLDAALFARPRNFFISDEFGIALCEGGLLLNANRRKCKTHLERELILRTAPPVS